MKKQYIIPNLEVLRIKTEDIICTSPVVSDDTSDTGKWNLSKSLNSDADMYNEDEDEEF